jgi:hypothetical protein
MCGTIIEAFVLRAQTIYPSGAGDLGK